MNKLFTLLILALSIIEVGISQTKSPDEFLGYELGDQFTRHFQVMNYFNHVAESGKYRSFYEDPI